LPGSVLVTRLSKDADVFAFAYSQNEAVERIHSALDSTGCVRLLRGMGYREIVLVGHSAGGLIARHFVEDHPDGGVTKVIQIGTPNEGTLLGKAGIGVRKSQEPFLHSLSKRGRRECLARRRERTIPDSVEFVCVVGQAELPERVTLTIRRDDADEFDITLSIDLPRGDGMVSLASQWPEDLQGQRIPAVFLRTTHFTEMQSKAAAERVSELVRERQPRWDASQVAECRRNLLGRERTP
jgi:pimeloyl-ACP methyl ester carboxylesterase